MMTMSTNLNAIVAELYPTLRLCPNSLYAAIDRFASKSRELLDMNMSITETAQHMVGAS